ncbi:hypothetical protein BJ165DRAFT_1508342, partial [Panaeolus papilionaceus]
MFVNMFLSKKECEGMGLEGDEITEGRDEMNIPGSDDFEEMLVDKERDDVFDSYRGRSSTITQSSTRFGVD